MKIGDKTVRDRRGAAERILNQVRESGTMPRHANVRTIQKLEALGAIHFAGTKYRLGPKPIREPGYYWVRDDNWMVAEWTGQHWYLVNGQRPFADEEFDVIAEKIERHPVVDRILAQLENTGA